MTWVTGILASSDGTTNSIGRTGPTFPKAWFLFDGPQSLKSELGALWIEQSKRASRSCPYSVDVSSRGSPSGGDRFLDKENSAAAILFAPDNMRNAHMGGELSITLKSFHPRCPVPSN